MVTMALLAAQAHAGLAWGWVMAGAWAWLAAAVAATGWADTGLHLPHSPDQDCHWALI